MFFGAILTLVLQPKHGWEPHWGRRTPVQKLLPQYGGERHRQGGVSGDDTAQQRAARVTMRFTVRRR